MRRCTTPILLIVLAVCLFAPSAALAQSAGDDQYSDPLAPTEPQQPRDEQPVQADPVPAAPAPAQGSQPSGAAAVDGRAPTPSGSSAPTGGELPRTGLPLLALLALGWPMLIGGIALHRAISRPRT